MPYWEYKTKRFNRNSLLIINQADEIISEYADAGYDLTLRQLYYQFVARDLFPDDRTWRWTGSRWVRDPDGTKNADPNYKWLGGLVNDGRLAGILDWDSIVDRTRFIRSNSHWGSPKDIVEACADQFRVDVRSTQDHYIEVWIEKDALIGVVEEKCSDLDVPCFSCRGFVSQSAMWGAATRRLIPAGRTGQQAVILHLGDHDPSGIDMTRDIQDRLRMFGCAARVERLALNMDQIEELEPPPNPAKLTDSRSQSYIAKYGDESWELDALEPEYIAKLIDNRVAELTDFTRLEKRVKEQDKGRKKLQDVVENL